jgi:hypothetical protein
MFLMLVNRGSRKGRGCLKILLTLEIKADKCVCVCGGGGTPISVLYKFTQIMHIEADPSCAQSNTWVCGRSSTGI